MNTYIAFYKDKQTEVKAPRSYDAQLIAAKLFKARKAYDVTVVLAATADGNPVVHNPAILD